MCLTKTEYGGPDRHIFQILKEMTYIEKIVNVVDSMMGTGKLNKLHQKLPSFSDSTRILEGFDKNRKNDHFDQNQQNA